MTFGTEQHIMMRAERVSLPPARPDSPRLTLLEARHAMTAPHPIVPGVRFKAVDGFDGYCVGDDGSAWTRRGRGGWRQLRTHLDRDGYVMVGLYRNGRTNTKKVHRLVLESFVGPCPDGHESCHRNGARADNRLENLRWGTEVENHADRVRHGNSRKGSKHHGAKLTEHDVAEIRRMRAEGEQLKAIASYWGVSEATVSLIARRKTWSHV